MVQANTDMGLQSAVGVLGVFRRVVLAAAQDMDGSGARAGDRASGRPGDTVAMMPNSPISLNSEAYQANKEQA